MPRRQQSVGDVMAKTRCPQCGPRVHKDGTTCPRCGGPLPADQHNFRAERERVIAELAVHPSTSEAGEASGENLDGPGLPDSAEPRSASCETCGDRPAVHFKFGTSDGRGWVTVFDGYLCRTCAEDTYQRLEGSPGVGRFVRSLLDFPNAANYQMGLAELDAKEANDDL